MPDGSLYTPGESDISARLDVVIADSVASIKNLQRDDGHWAFELEADVTITAEYIFLNHFLGEIEDDVEAELAAYIRSTQADNGGWPLFHGGQMNLSSTVKAYYALKIVGDDVDAPHMEKAREAILKAGGAERSNVFTRYALALFGQVPWRAVPVMPIELMLMPKWFPVHMGRFSYWSRTVIAPLLILAAKKPLAKNPRGVSIAELFTRPPEEITDYLKNYKGKGWGAFFLNLDKVLRFVEPKFPRRTREKAIDKAIDFFTERLNGEDGLGAIFPAMSNSVMAMEALGISRDDPHFKAARKSIRALLTPSVDGKRYCQPCVSPIWDTSLAAHALLEAGEEPDSLTIRSAFDWMKELQILDIKGDWADARPDVRPGGWAFQYRNDHYPDLDDTAVVAMAMDRVGDQRDSEAIDRAQEWIEGLQSRNGGWGAFDADNTNNYLNKIPFADHGALLDPPTADVTARCLSLLAQRGHGRDHPAVRRAIQFLKKEQEIDGSWFGRWGTNYIYGTWSVLCALNMVGKDMDAPYIRHSVDWLLLRQHDDGGWGEDGATYWEDEKAKAKASTPSQTAWALLALMAAGKVDHPAVRHGIEFLLSAERCGDKWREDWFTAVGFPRVFYLRYDGYSRYFPIWALARYRNLTRSNSKRVSYGM